MEFVEVLALVLYECETQARMTKRAHQDGKRVLNDLSIIMMHLSSVIFCVRRNILK